MTAHRDFFGHLTNVIPVSPAKFGILGAILGIEAILHVCITNAIHQLVVSRIEFTEYVSVDHTVAPFSYYLYNDRGTQNVGDIQKNFIKKRGGKKHVSPIIFRSVARLKCRPERRKLFLCRRLVIGAHAIIEFALRLCAGRTHRDPTAIVEHKSQHIGGREALCLCFLGCVILHAFQLCSRDLGRVLAAESRRKRGNLFLPVGAAEEEVRLGVKIKSKARVKLAQHIDKGLSVFLVVRRSLAKHKRRLDSILIADKITYKAAVAFLIPENIVCIVHGKMTRYALADEFEARQRLFDLYTVGLANAVAEVGGHYRVDHDRTLGHSAARTVSGEDIFDKDRAGLIARHESERTVAVARRNAEAVAVGVGRDDDIGIHLVRKLKRRFIRKRGLGIGAFCCRKIGIRRTLLLDRHHIVAKVGKHMPHGDIARTVLRGKYHTKVAGIHAAQRYRLDRAIVFLVNAVVKNADKSVCLIDTKGTDIERIADGGYAFDDLGSLAKTALASLGILYFVAVVLRRVVRRRYHYAARRAEMTHGKGKFRCRAKRIEQPRMNAVRGKNTGCCQRKLT